MDPFVKDKIIRAGGRLKNSSLSFEVKHPYILPKYGHITKLLIAHYHEKVNHQENDFTLNELHSNGICIVGGSKNRASFIFKCI